MKRGYFFSILILLISFLIITNNTAIYGLEDEETKIEKAYDCLLNKVENQCSTSLEENIFVLLSVGKCKKEVIKESDGKKCWPASNCDIKTTAQAILALNEMYINTDEAVKWLFSQNKTSTDLEWYLEIESPKPANCVISYSNNSYDIEIGEDKKISNDAGSCLTLSEGNWWLKISESCYNEEFQISCDEQFLTALLFKKQDSSTIHVLKGTSSASAEGTTKEKINSLCFSKKTSCDYEGSLWAVLALDDLGYDVSPYLSYLIAMKDENKEYLPESFLYFLTDSSDIRSSLLLKQKSDKYWDESGDKFYDTAMALYPFQYDEIQEKKNSKEWLLEVQQEDGCWNGGNLRDNAFLLYSVWPGYYNLQICGDGVVEGAEKCDGSNLNNQLCYDLGYSGGNLSCYSPGTENECTFDTSECTGELNTCERVGYTCIPEDENCTGNILEQYVCPNEGEVCCDEFEGLDTCKEKNGTICNSDEFCTGNYTENVSDLEIGEVCCLTGYCESENEPPDCQEAGYYCMSEMNCQGNILKNYDCAGTFKCCDTPKSSNTCYEQGGEVCSSNEECNGNLIDASDLEIGETCCTNGICQTKAVEPECEKNYYGICRYSCEDDEERKSYECDGSKVCCIKKESPPPKKNYFWIILLIILIILVVLGIIFRDRLRPYYLKIKSKFRKGSSKNFRGSRRPPSFPPSVIPRGPLPRRRILPPSGRRIRHPPPRRKSEVDDILKKLKNMGK